MPLCCCEAEPSRSLFIRVSRRKVPNMIQCAQLVLSLCMPLCYCEAVPPPSLSTILSNTQTSMVAPPDRMLSEAAARCSALPCKYKPVSYIFGNTSAINEA